MCVYIYTYRMDTYYVNKNGGKVPQPKRPQLRHFVPGHHKDTYIYIYKCVSYIYEYIYIYYLYIIYTISVSTCLCLYVCVCVYTFL